MKKILALLLAAAMVLSLAACGGASSSAASAESKSEEAAPASSEEAAPASSEEAAPAEEQEEAPAEDVLLYVYMQDISNVDTWLQVIDKFESEHPGIEVELMDSQDNYFATILATGDMPDIINPAMSETARAMIDAGLIYDISGLECYQHLPQYYRDAETYNGVCLGVPQGSAFTAMYYNMKILNEAGWTELPKDRDEFFKCMQDCMAKGYDGITFAGAKTTTCFMPFECTFPGYAGMSGSEYEAAFKEGSIDFNNEEEAAFLDEFAKYVMPGSTANKEDDVVSAMASGEVACCIAGNWSSGNLCPAIEGAAGEGMCACSLPPFQKAGDKMWVSVSPESTYAMSAVDQGEAHNKARLELYEWVWRPENYSYFTKSHGTIPVLDWMTEDDIAIQPAMTPVVADLTAAPSVSMGFNLWSGEACDIICTALNDVYAGNMSAADCLAMMTDAVHNAPMN